MVKKETVDDLFSFLNEPNKKIWLIVLFLVLVTVMMHNFWAIADPMMKQMQMSMFMKNISMLGGALLITYFGSGPLSIDAQSKMSLKQNA